MSELKDSRILYENEIDKLEIQKNAVAGGTCYVNVEC